MLENITIIYKEVKNGKAFTTALPTGGSILFATTTRSGNTLNMHATGVYTTNEGHVELGRRGVIMPLSDIKNHGLLTEDEHHTSIILELLDTVGGTTYEGRDENTALINLKGTTRSENR